MTTTPSGLNPATQRLKSILDMVATIAVIAGSAAVLVLTISRWHEVPQAPVAWPGAPEMAPPSTPHPLAGAELLGDSKARVTLVEYSDFECPFCADYALKTWPGVKKTYVDSGKVLVAFRHLPLPGHRFAQQAAIAANCAARQGRFWSMHDELFRQQATLSHQVVRDVASSLGLDRDGFTRCLAQRTEDLSADHGYAQLAGIRGTPTFLVGIKTEEDTVNVKRVLIGVQPFERMAKVLDEALAELGDVPRSALVRR